MPNRVLTLTKIKRNPITFLALGNSLSYQDKSGTGTLSASGALRYQPGSGGRVNFSPNPSFEGVTNLPAAYQPGATVTRSSDRAYQGSTAIQVVTDGSVSNQGSVGPIVAKGFVGAGMTVYASVWVWAPVGATLTYLVEEYNAAGTYLRTGGGAESTGTGDWQQVFLTKTLGAGVGLLKHALRTSTTAQAITFYYDAETIEINPVSGTYGQYFDGSSAGCAWADPITGIAGTANASPSISKAAFWVEEGTTNLILNPSTEVDALNLSGNWGGATSATRVTTHAYAGSAALYSIASAAASSGVGRYTGTGLNTVNTPYTGSVYVRAGNASQIGKQVRVFLYGYYTDLSNGTMVGSTVTATLTDAWQRVTVTMSGDPVKTLDKIGCITVSVSTDSPEFLTDAVQVEQKTYATSYCDGSLGTGYTWAGTAHASASTRAQAGVYMPYTARFSQYRGSIATQFNMPTTIGTRGRAFRVGQASPGQGDYFSSRVNVDKTVTHDIYSDGLSSGSISSPALATGWHTIVYDWDESTMGLTVDATARVTTGRSRLAVGLINGPGTDFFIGSYSVGVERINSVIGPFAIFDRPLTDAERAILAATDPVNWWNALA